jgi:hypothetical protein
MEKQGAEDKAAKAEWTKEVQNLRIKYRMLNRTKYQPLLALRPEGKMLVEQLEKQEGRFEQEQQEESARLGRAIGILRQATRDLKTLLQSAPVAPDDRRLGQLQTKTSEIESGLKDFKVQSRERYNALQGEEALLSKDLSIYTEKFEAMLREQKEERSQQQQQRAQRTKKPPQGQRTQLVPAGVSEVNEEEMEDSSAELQMVKAKLAKVEEALQGLGGTYCGWDRGDHDDYLKVKTKHHGKTKTIAFLNELQKLLPDQNAEGIAKHAEDHELQLKLLAEKKQLLARYKELKREELRQADAPDDGDQEQENRGKDTNPRVATADLQSQQDKQKQKQKQKQDLEEWRKKKREEQELKIAQEAEEKKAQLAQKARKTETEQARKKQQLREYKERKALEEMQKKEEEARDRERNMKETKPEDVVKLLEREQATFLKRQEIVEMRKLQKIEKLERQERAKRKTQEHFRHVAPKLNAETAAQVQKKRDKFDGTTNKRDAHTFGGEVLHTQMRAVPTWRAGL